MNRYIALALTTFAFGALTHAAFADGVSIPKPIRADLDHRYPHWQLYDLDAMQPGERKYCKAEPGWSSFVTGDFNGDGQPDYAVLIASGKRGYALAYMKRGTEYRAFNLFPAKPGDTGSAGYLMLAAKGAVHGSVTTGRSQAALQDGVSLIFCESSLATYFFKHGRFVQKVEVD